MGKLMLLLVMFFTSLTVQAFEGINGTTSLKLFNQIQCSTGLSCSRSFGKFVMTSAGSPSYTTLTVSGASILSGAVTGDGGDALSGFLMAQVASITGSLTLAQCGSTIVSDSADVIVLPEASTALGCRYTFVCGTADDFDVDPADGTDVIGITGSITGTNTTTVLAPSAGDALRCTDVGAGFVLEAVANDLWAVLSTNGIITDVN